MITLPTKGISYIDSNLSKEIDDTLMSEEYGYSIDQLMEIAGLSVSIAIDKVVNEEDGWQGVKKILNISGPGNNGGDGLVAARYLKEFGYNVDILYPKTTTKDLYIRLMKQCKQYSINFLGISILDELNQYDLIIDSVFGFSCSGDIRPPYNEVIDALNSTKTKICSIDVPSGWNVNEGNINNNFTPDMLVSLTLPKLCSKNYTGIHYLGGRFVPPELSKSLDIKMPDYKSSHMVVHLEKPSSFG